MSPENSLVGSVSILGEAHSIIYGDREQTYGSPDKNLKLISDYWTVHLGFPICIDDVCMMMMMVKLARLKNQPEHHDSQVDICGYAALMERVQIHKKQQMKQTEMKGQQAAGTINQYPNLKQS